ncbi:MAG: N-formylglutamate amidohydrolase [Polyangiaceae bacterium]
MTKSAVAATSATAHAAAEAMRKANGSAVDAALAGFFADAGAREGALLAPMVAVAVGVGAGARVLDCRARQPGLGVERPRGTTAEQEPPIGARVSAPLTPFGAVLLHNARGRASLAEVVSFGRDNALATGDRRRAALLDDLGAMKAAVCSSEPYVEALLAIGGRVAGGALLAGGRGGGAARPRLDHRTVALSGGDAGTSRVYEAPWAREVHAAAVRAEIVAAAVDAWASPSSSADRCSRWTLSRPCPALQIAVRRSSPRPCSAASRAPRQEPDDMRAPVAIVDRGSGAGDRRGMRRWLDGERRPRGGRPRERVLRGAGCARAARLRGGCRARPRRGARVLGAWRCSLAASPRSRFSGRRLTRRRLSSRCAARGVRVRRRVDGLATCAPVRGIGRDAEMFVDRLFRYAPLHGATMLVGHLSRLVVDLNRGPDDVDGLAAEGGTGHALPRGLVWRTTTEGESVLLQRLPRAELERRLDLYYRPYHAALRAIIEEKKRAFGFAILVCAHSMPSEGRRGHVDVGAGRADIVPGSRGRTTAAAAVIDAVDRVAQRASLSVKHDDPYKGGFSTGHYGKPSERVHAIQIEIARRLYMNEEALALTDGAVAVARFAMNVVATLGALTL